MKKQLFLFVSIFLFSFLIVPAQTAPTDVKQISAGVLNGKAVTLSKPAYPAAARAVGAQGAVNVKIMVDEEGNVVSAEAVSGHPLLQQAAVQAAQQSKFHPTTLNGQAVKVTGVVVYNFVAPERATNWLKTGYDLTSAQHAPSLMHLDTNSIDKLFQADWTTEREQLKRLSEIKQAESSSFTPPVATGERRVSETTEKRPDGTTVKKVVTEYAVKAEGEPNSEQISISQSLIASLQSRLGGEELNLWRFNTGVSLSRALSKQRFTNERQGVLDSLRSQIQSAPSGVSPDYIADLQKILAILENPKSAPEDRNQVGQIMQRLFRN
jgi:TonB family protein